MWATMRATSSTAPSAASRISYFSWEGGIKHTKKDDGDFEGVARGTFTWLGGTGKFKTIKGSGTYTCKFTSKGDQCDRETEPEM